MDPIIGGAIIGGIANLFGGLMGQKAQEEEARRNREFQGIQQGYEAKKQGAAAIGANTQNAFAQMMSAYKSALLG
jgi:hypothetical protein